MASLRVLPRLRLLLRGGLPARGPAPARRAPPPPWPLRAASAHIRVPGGGGWTGGSGAGHDGIAVENMDDDAEPEDGDADPEEDAELLHPEEDEEPLFPLGPQRVFVLHPHFRGPGGRTPGEAETVRACPGVTCVFLDVERTAAPTQRELEAAWGVPVLDRFSVVLRVFRCHARSREARLQLALAELPLLRSSVNAARQEGRGSRYIMGSGESPAELRRRALRAREATLARALERVRAQRAVLRGGRRGLPVVAVVGYTNSGKTTLVRALTGDPALRPRARPCSTLDVTAHAGRLPCGARVLYVDTVGFLERLPHGLVHAFAATLGDVAHADVLVHVRDASHPDAGRQAAAVLSALRGLRLPRVLLESALEVHNKADLVPGPRPPGPGALCVSALHGRGLDELRAALEEAVLRATGTRVLTLCVPLGGPQLSWLHREASVQRVRDAPGAPGSAHVTVAIARAALGRFRRRFPGAQEVGAEDPPPAAA